MEIIFIGDINRGDQAYNIKNIYDLFSPIFVSEGFKVSLLITEINLISDRDIWIPKWSQSLKENDLSSIENINFDNKFVVGFEIPEFVIGFFNKINVKWVNLSIHPIRFSDDLYFNVESSFSYDHDHNSIDEAYLYFKAQMIKRSFYRNKENNNKRSILLLGQEPFDKSIYFDNEFKSLLHYENSIMSLLNNYAAVFYKPHISVNNPNLDQMIIEKFGATLIQEKNFYELLSKKTIDTCCAISSSTLYQSKYFDSKAIFLESRVKKFGKPIIFSNLFNDKNFWIKSLLDIELVQPISKTIKFNQENFLRNIFSNWGYFPLSPDALHLNHLIHLSNLKINELENEIIDLQDQVGKLNKSSFLEKIKKILS